MKSAQKVIKYVALAFGVFLAVTIISGIISAALAAFSFFGFLAKGAETIDFSASYENVTELDVYNSAGEIKILLSDELSSNEFKVDAAGVPDSFSSSMKGESLIISNRARFNVSLFGLNNNARSVITIYLPKEADLESVRVENGAGKVSIQGVNSGDFHLETGAGACYVDSIVADRASFEVGVGEISVSSGVLGKMNVDAGVGRFYMKGELNGDGNINGGVGSIELELENKADDHSFDIDGRIGTVKIDGKSYSDGKISASNPKGTIEIDGGVGEVKINYLR